MFLAAFCALMLTVRRSALLNIFFDPDVSAPSASLLIRSRTDRRTLVATPRLAIPIPMRPWTHQSWLTRYVPCVRRHVHDNGAIALPPRFLQSGSELALGVPRRPDSDTYRKVGKCL